MQDPFVSHIVWDWNGTIFNDSRALIDATLDAFDACAMPPITIADYQREHTQPIPEFYNRLAGRTLTDDEQDRLNQSFMTSYLRYREKARLTDDAVAAMSRWRAADRRQSLLSMHPHERLMPLVERAGITEFFTRIDGTVGELPYKAPHLAEHLERQGIAPEHAVVVGDSVDDAQAARECGVRCLLYHSGEDALHAREHFAELRVPVVESLTGAVSQLLDPDSGRLGRPLSHAAEAGVVGVVPPSEERA
ncbi:putative hydrolase [Streptomyces sp. NBRC 110611]|uniref:HAD family hydrolase n=1 Tax=Streptomyces sp. NBRC 110611 TaxID=1621259 RepID=UPI000858098A|nr:HAD family hydrolase [Streptomyces sp. NBRC 110611]GAU66496.1 putative hydrolase [Streptomyces sp. NBRC 110611]